MESVIIVYPKNEEERKMIISETQKLDIKFLDFNNLTVQKDKRFNTLKQLIDDKRRSSNL